MTLLGEIKRLFVCSINQKNIITVLAHINRRTKYKPIYENESSVKVQFKGKRETKLQYHIYSNCYKILNSSILNFLNPICKLTRKYMQISMVHTTVVLRHSEELVTILSQGQVSLLQSIATSAGPSTIVGQTPLHLVISFFNKTSG